MNSRLINIEELDFKEANLVILDLCKSKDRLSLNEIGLILNLKEKELVDSFLYEYALFNQEDLVFIENFINLNLENIDKNFVSDLIYFACDFGLDLNYKKIISFLLIEKEDNDCFVLSCLVYINNNIKFIYIEEIFKNLNYICDNTLYHQNEQLLASLVLFRITQKANHLDLIKELIENNERNLEFFNNILKEKMYSSKYFDLAEILKIMR